MKDVWLTVQQNDTEYQFQQYSGDGKNDGLFYKMTTTIAKVSVHFHVDWTLKLLCTLS
jgi:hypothetical protein